MRYKNELIAALLEEMRLFQANHKTGPLPIIETIYFGGGTPSLLSAAELASIIERLKEVFSFAEDLELTLEANPDDLDDAQLQNWKSIGINRLSLGVQSFYDEDLKWMNRAHDAKQAIENLQLANSYFDNISMDLIYGGPTLSDEHWISNLEKATTLNIPHLSCYALTIEPKTPLQKMIALGKVSDVDTDRQANQFLMLMDFLDKAGYEHYEVSNFAKPGFRSRHNSSYWQGKEYYGFGPSAHSFEKNTRYWNISNNQTYIDSIGRGIIPSEKEVLDITQKIHEYIMISMRRIEGIDSKILFGYFEEKGNEVLLKNEFSKKIDHWVELGKLEKINGQIMLTKDGMLLADGIAADLFPD